MDYETINNRFYNTLKHKKGIKQVGWESDAYLRRFEVFADIDKFKGKAILDVGCGRGDLSVFLKKHNPYRSYMGVDLYPHDFLKADKNTSFIVFDILSADSVFLPGYDYIFASGIFNLKATSGITKRMIRRCFELSKKGFAFNMLGSFAPRGLKRKHLKYYDPHKIVHYCRTLTPHVRLIKGYLPHDFTVVVRR